MRSPTLPRRRWAWTAALWAALVAWVASVPARADDDGHDWALKAQTDEGISQVWRTDGVATEEGFFRAWFATFENPSIKPPSTPWERSYADFLWTCAQVNRAAYLKALTADERASIKNLLFAYTATLTTDYGNSFFVSVPAAQTDCDDPLILPDVYQNRADDTLDLTILGSALHESPPQQLLDKMHAWRTGTPVGITDLFALYIADTYPALLGFDKKATLALMPAYGSPRELIGQKTTPSFAYNHKVADELALPIGWDQMGMNDYWSFGYTPIHSFLARKSYEHPLITALVPIIGPALSAGDGWLTMLEGKDAAGQDTNRLLGAGSFAINWAFAVADVGFVKGLSIGTYKTLREGARLAKKLATPGEAKALMLTLRKALREAPQAGPEAHRALTRLGDPVDPHLTLWVEALGSEESAGRTYGQLMRISVRDAAMRTRHATTTGSKITYQSVRKVLERGSNLVARKLKNEEAAKFAKVRLFGDGLGTYINGKYARFADQIREFCLKHGIKHADYCEVQVVGVIDGTEIPLTHMVIYEMKVGRFGYGAIQHWAHDFVPEAQIVTKIDDHLELLFKKAIDPKATREEIVAAVAEIQWWEANTTRWVRGTQGISDATAKALLEARGIEVGRWKPDLSPDFEAFVRSKDDFVANYPDLFIRAADTPAPVLTPVAMYKMPEPNGAYPFSIKSAYSDNGIVGYGAVSITGKIHGWAVDHSQLENVDDFPEAQWGGVQFDISIREVVGDEENEVEKVEATLPSPPEMPAEWVEKRKSHHGFEWEIPADKEAATLRVYAVHPLLENEEVLLFETAGNTCEPEPCNSSVDWKWAFCDFACECQPACLCVQPDFINGGCLLWDDQWSCPGEPNPVFCF